MYTSRMRPPACCPYLPACTARGGSAPGGLLPGGACSGGVSPGGVLPLPPVNRMTDRCKNITLPQLR